MDNDFVSVEFSTFDPVPSGDSSVNMVDDACVSELLALVDGQVSTSAPCTLSDGFVRLANPSDRFYFVSIGLTPKADGGKNRRLLFPNSERTFNADLNMAVQVTPLKAKTP